MTRNYLTPEWWADLSQTELGSCDGESAHLTVQYALSDDSGVHQHHQMFCGPRLVKWRSGPCAEPDLLIRRSLADDRGDLLGRASPSTVLAGTRLATGASVAETDVFGVGAGWQRRIPDVPDELRVGCILQAEDSPFGPVDAHYVLNGTKLSPGSVDLDEVVTIRATYRTILKWLHQGHLGLGPLIFAGQVAGPIYAISALSGVVSDLVGLEFRFAQDVEMCQRLIHYSQARLSTSTLSIMDTVDDWTAQ